MFPQPMCRLTCGKKEPHKQLQILNGHGFNALNLVAFDLLAPETTCGGQVNQAAEQLDQKRQYVNRVSEEQNSSFLRTRIQTERE